MFKRVKIFSKRNRDSIIIALFFFIIGFIFTNFEFLSSYLVGGINNLFINISRIFEVSYYSKLASMHYKGISEFITFNSIVLIYLVSIILVTVLFQLGMKYNDENTEKMSLSFRNWMRLLLFIIIVFTMIIMLFRTYNYITFDELQKKYFSFRKEMILNKSLMSEDETDQLYINWVSMTSKTEYNEILEKLEMFKKRNTNHFINEK